MPQDDIWIRVSDLRQHAYCPRVVYYKYVVPVGFRQSHKMGQGRQSEEVETLLEKRRTMRRYGLSQARRVRGRSLASSKLKLSGRLDQMLESDKQAWPVEFKDTTGGVRRNHVIQLAAYALLIEDQLGKRCNAGFICIIPDKTAVRVELGRGEKESALSAADEVRRIIREQECPGPTRWRPRCRDCEYRNYCGDVF